jgi:hypothetical protein
MARRKKTDSTQHRDRYNHKQYLITVHLHKTKASDGFTHARALHRNTSFPERWFGNSRDELRVRHTAHTIPNQTKPTTTKNKEYESRTIRVGLLLSFIEHACHQSSGGTHVRRSRRTKKDSPPRHEQGYHQSTRQANATHAGNVCSCIPGLKFQIDAGTRGRQPKVHREGLICAHGIPCASDGEGHFAELCALRVGINLDDAAHHQIKNKNKKKKGCASQQGRVCNTRKEDLLVDIGHYHRAL